MPCDVIPNMMLDRFLAFRCDRNDGRLGGGVAVLVRKGVHHLESEVVVNTGNIQLISLIVSLQRASMVVCCVYRGPGASEFEDESLLRGLHLFSQRAKQLLIMGDFNLPNIDWRTQSVTTCRTSCLFLDWFHEHGLYQHVREATRIRGGCLPSLLDLVLTTSESGITNMQCGAPLGKSDHVVLFFNAVVRYTKPPAKLVRSFTNIDQTALRIAASQQDWSTNTVSIEEAWVLLTTNVKRIQESFVPQAAMGKGNHPKWWTPAIRRSIRARDRSWRKYKASLTQGAWVRYKASRNAAISLQRLAKRKFELSLARLLKRLPNRTSVTCNLKEGQMRLLVRSI